MRQVAVYIGEETGEKRSSLENDRPLLRGILAEVMTELLQRELSSLFHILDKENNNRRRGGYIYGGSPIGGGVAKEGLFEIIRNKRKSEGMLELTS